jgi:hypothetical protein
MMNNESFIKLAHEHVSEDNVIRSKIDNKLGQLLKKNGRPVTPHELFVANLDGISNQLDKLSVAPGTNMVHAVPSVPEIVEFVDQDGQASIRAPHVVLKPGSLGLLCPGQAMLAEDTDDEKGKHIGSGIYLKREGHLIKMTTPNFTVYY